MCEDTGGTAMKHLIDPMDLSLQEIDELLELADDIIANKDKYSKICEGKKLATLFLNQVQEHV